jgi:hypothetical protein
LDTRDNIRNAQPLGPANGGLTEASRTIPFPPSQTQAFGNTSTYVRRTVQTFAFSLIVALCASCTALPRAGYSFVPIAEIAHDPVPYVGHYVATAGILRSDREHLAVYPNRVMASELDTPAAIWIQSARPTQWRQILGLPDFCPITVVGRITMPRGGSGHMSLFQVQLDDIIAIVPTTGTLAEP